MSSNEEKYQVGDFVQVKANKQLVYEVISVSNRELTLKHTKEVDNKIVKSNCICGSFKVSRLDCNHYELYGSRPFTIKNRLDLIEEEE